MNLNLTKLRQDYKLVYYANSELASRIAILIEFYKIDNSCNSYDLKNVKRIKLLALCRGCDLSMRTLFRWRRNYILGGIYGLTRKKNVGKIPNEIDPHTQTVITQMRKQKRWGAEVICAHLKHDYNINLSKYRVERFLTRSGIRDKYPCTTRKRKLKEKKTHTKVVQILIPGEHTQIDTKHQPKLLQNGKKCYVLNFIDHASNWSFKRAYEKISPLSTLDFMNRLIKECPFEIKRIQSDNGTEFTYKYYKKYVDVVKKHPFEEFCKQHDIVHKLIPPGEKELQGLVERSHRQDDQELYSNIQPNEIREFNFNLEAYCKERNSGRRFKKNDWQTADEYLNNFVVANLVFLSLLLEKRTKREQPIENIFEYLKNEDVPFLTDLVPSQKNDFDVNKCKEKDKTDEKIDIKKAS